MRSTFALFCSFLLVVVVCCKTLDRPTRPDHIHPLSNDAIDWINSIGTTWKAGRNFDENTPLSQLRGLMGVQKNVGSLLPKIFHKDIGELPDSFDARQKWPHCPTINQIRDQGSCGSCWAFGAVEVISDRICIHSNGKLTPQISAENLIACCEFCGNGCNGGNPLLAFFYYALQGLVTGGLYDSKVGCQPYEIEPCEHHTTGKRKPCGQIVPTPQCSQTCRAGYNVSYNEDLHFGSSVYQILSDQEQIKKEILTNGPVEADFTVFDDFVNYKSGVYQAHSTNVLGGHAIRILGWGVENNTPYWLCANSWNTDWADLGGYFKILRGSSECGIENDILAPTPK